MAGRGLYYKLSDPQDIILLQERFCAAYAAWGNDSKALKETTVPARLLQRWKTEDTEGFLRRYEGAKSAYADLLEEILDNHIKEIKPGQSIIPLIFRLKAERPWKYRDYPPKADDGAWALVKMLEKMFASQEAERQKMDKEPQKGDSLVSYSLQQEIEDIMKGKPEGAGGHETDRRPDN